MKIAALQTVSGAHVGANLDTAATLLAEAAGAGAELAILPEYFCLMGQRDTDKLAVREPAGSGAVQAFLAERARTLGLWIVGGTLPLVADSDRHVRNTSLAFSPAGECVARYDKIHLFRFDNGRGEQYDEARVIEAGRTPQSFVLPSRDGHAWRVGLSVCYDLRFPELYRALGADLLLVPSAFTHGTGQAHWEILLRARAIENQCYVLAAAQGGRHPNGRRTWGHSMLVDPWGEVMAVLPEGEGVVGGDIDPARLDTVRGNLPALRHRVL